jgi:flagellar biosynthesis/type III secretory pathway protein FliH
MWYNNNTIRVATKRQERKEIPMKYTVSINEKKRTVTVNLEGYEGVAKCCPTDCFNVQTGVELALERAKVAKANAENAKKATQKTAPVGSMANRMSVEALAKQLEKTLPMSSIVVAVGGGDMCLNDSGKEWLAKLAGKCACKCDKEHLSEDEIEVIKCTAYDEGFEKGYGEGKRAGRKEALDYVSAHMSELVDGWVEGFTEAVGDCLDEAAENMAD